MKELQHKCLRLKHGRQLPTTMYTTFYNEAHCQNQLREKNAKKNTRRNRSLLNCNFPKKKIATLRNAWNTLWSCDMLCLKRYVKEKKTTRNFLIRAQHESFMLILLPLLLLLLLLSLLSSNDYGWQFVSHLVLCLRVLRTPLTWLSVSCFKIETFFNI